MDRSEFDILVSMEGCSQNANSRKKEKKKDDVVCGVLS